MAAASAGRGFFLLGRFAGELGGDLLGAGLGRRRDGGIRRGNRAGTRQQVVVLVGIGLERQGGAPGQGSDQLVRGRLVVLWLGCDRDLGLGLDGARGPFLLALDAGIRDQRRQQPDRPDGVVV